MNARVEVQFGRAPRTSRAARVMPAWLRRSFATLAVAAATSGGSTLEARAETHATTRSYLVTTTVQTAQGAIKANETLTVRAGSAPAFASVSNESGASLSTPIAFAADGEILQIGAQSVVCYNMATALVAQAVAQAGQADPRGSVLVALGDGVVPVPLTLQRSPASAAGRVQLTGTGRRDVTLHDANSALDATLLVDAHVSVATGELHDATFNEATLLATQGKMLNRLTCSLARLAASDA